MLSSIRRKDGDPMTVNTAMSSLERSNAILVGDDTDLLIVAMHKHTLTDTTN